MSGGVTFSHPRDQFMVAWLALSKDYRKKVLSNKALSSSGAYDQIPHPIKILSGRSKRYWLIDC